MNAVFVELPAFARYRDVRRGKGSLGGLRVIYYWWDGGPEFWLFTLYDKDELADLSASDRKLLRDRLTAELKARK